MQAFGLSLIKGRLGSDQERREIQTSPERKRARGPVFGASRRTKPSNAAAGAIDGVRPRSRPGPIRIDRHKELSHVDDNAVFAVGNARGASTRRQTPRRREPRTDIPSALRSRQAMVVGESTLVKAGLRPPPPAASALTRLRSQTSRAAREIKGWERPSSHFPRSPPRGVKKAPRPIDKKAPIRARP